MTEYPLRLPAMIVRQPLGTFFVTVVKASVLLDTCFSEHLRAERVGDGGGYVLDGTQRLLRSDRLRSIAEFISRMDAGFPNSIILGANFKSEDGTIDEHSADRWRVEEVGGGRFELVIPSRAKQAAVIDGQHRLFAFAQAIPSAVEQTELVCSVFLDIPKSLQASLFATINSTQMPVSKSLTFELFGYNVDEEAPEYWSPDKLAVFFARRLAVDEGSPLRGRIALAPEADFLLVAEGNSPWRVSIAVVVQGILRLISGNPRQDANALMTGAKRQRREIAGIRPDRSPLRQQYIETNDMFVFKTVLNFLRACDEVLWAQATPESFITRTVAIQALFDILRLLLPQALEQQNLSTAYFAGCLAPAGAVNFAAPRFNNASGSGRTFIRKVLEIATGLSGPETLEANEYAEVFP